MGRTRYVVALMLLAVLVAGWGGCSVGTAFKTMEVSGESLDAVGRNFNSINDLAVQGCDVTKHIKKETCNAWVDFFGKFQKSYRPAYEGWQLARKTNDTARQQSAAETIKQLSKDLGVLTVRIVDISQGGNK